MKPGKPISFGVRGATLVFGLPGNPVSSLVGFELFVRPALLALQGAREPGPSFRAGRARLERSPELRARRVPACAPAVDDGALLEPLTGQESHMIARASAADALVLAPRGDGELEAGSTRPLPACSAETAHPSATGRRATTSTARRIERLIGPSGGRSAASGYGA